MQNHLYALYGLPGGHPIISDDFDKADILRKRRKYEEHEEKVAAELLRAVLNEEDFEIPDVKETRIREILTTKYINTNKEKDKKALQLLLLMLAMED